MYDIHYKPYLGGLFNQQRHTNMVSFIFEGTIKEFNCKELGTALSQPYIDQFWFSWDWPNFNLRMARLVVQKLIHQLTFVQPACWKTSTRSGSTDPCILTARKTENISAGGIPPSTSTGELGLFNPLVEQNKLLLYGLSQCKILGTLGSCHFATSAVFQLVCLQRGMCQKAGTAAEGGTYQRNSTASDHHLREDFLILFNMQEPLI